MKDELLQLLCEKGFKYREEGFTLASGKQSKFYIDCRVVMSSAKAKYLISHLIYEKIAPLHADAIGGPETGAIPIADAVSYLSYLKGREIKSFWIRKEPRVHGLRKWIEGDVKNGDRVIIVDDVVTTGKSTIEAVQRAKEGGLTVVKVIVLVDREEERGRQNIEQQGVEAEAVFTIKDLMGIHNKRRSHELKKLGDLKD